MKSAVKKVFFVFAFLSSVMIYAQNRTFPNGSASGNTQMNRNVRPATVPNISIDITEPRTGREVAFSVRLLILLTALSLAPSLLILLTCFLRFSIS